MDKIFVKKYYSNFDSNLPTQNLTNIVTCNLVTSHIMQFYVQKVPKLQHGWPLIMKLEKSCSSDDFFACRSSLAEFLTIALKILWCRCSVKLENCLSLDS